MILTILLLSSRSAANSALFSSLTVTSCASRESFFTAISGNSFCRCKCMHSVLVMCTSNWDKTSFASLIHFCSHAYVGFHLSKVSPSSNQVRMASMYEMCLLYVMAFHITAHSKTGLSCIPSNPVKNL